MKTLILITDSQDIELAAGRFPTLLARCGTAFPGLMRADPASDLPCALMFARYAKAWGKKYYIWDGADPQSDFPENLQSLDCLILCLPAGQTDFAKADASLCIMLDSLRGTGEECRLLLIGTSAPGLGGSSAYDSPAAGLIDASDDDDDEPETETESGESDETAETPETPEDESETPDGSGDSGAAGGETSDMPVPADTLTGTAGSGAAAAIPFMLFDPQADAKSGNELPAGAPLESDTLCRLVFLGIASEGLENIDSAKSESREKSSFFSDIFDWVEIFCIALVSVILLMTFVVRRSPVEGSSMYPTLIGHNAAADTNLNPETGVKSGYDDLLISNLFYTPKRLDIVIIQEPTQPAEPIVKRIIGLSGDHIKMDFDTWEVYVNGVLLDEPYVNKKDYTLGHQLLPVDENNCWEGDVPEGCIFVLGDNRGVSKDSRSFGFIDQRYIIGRVFFRIGPFSRFGTVSSGN